MNYHVIVANGDRSRAALEGFLLHCLVVAGKTAHIQVEKLNRVLALVSTGTPFERLRVLHNAGTLMDAWRAAGLGKYTTAEAGLPLLLEVDPSTVTVAELEEIPGIGPKTARYYALYARGEEVAALDTHILKFLRDVLAYPAPKTTPARGRKYREMEQVFIRGAYSFGLSPQEMDNVVWQFYSGHIEEAFPGATRLKPTIFFTAYAKKLREEAA